MQTLKQVWSLWKRIAEAIGNVIGRLVLTVFYFTILAPFGLGVRSWSDPLAMKVRRDLKWVSREVDSPSLDKARRLG